MRNNNKEIQLKAKKLIIILIFKNNIDKHFQSIKMYNLLATKKRKQHYKKEIKNLLL